MQQTWKQTKIPNKFSYFYNHAMSDNHKQYKTPDKHITRLKN
jgi:hypothetical protein